MIQKLGKQVAQFQTKLQMHVNIVNSQYYEAIKQCNDQIKELQQNLEPKKDEAFDLVEFKHEALELNSQHVKQQQILYEN